MQKQTQEEIMSEFISTTGFITTRQAQSLNICSPNEIIRRIKHGLGLCAFYALTREGKRIKIHYTDRRAAINYVQNIGGRLA